MKRLVTGFILASLLLPTLVSAAELPDRDDYAWRFGLEIDSSREFQSVELPLEVYRSVSDPGLRDLGVYNAAGQAVPRIIASADAGNEAVEKELRLAPLPLAAAPEQLHEQLQLLMQQSETGTTLRLDSQRDDSRPDAGGEELSAYLVDLRELETELVALSLDWAPVPQGFIGSIKVSSSDDLQHWRQLAQATVAELEHQGARIEQNRVPLTGPAGNFLRISWTGMPDGWRLDTLNGISRESGPEDKRLWQELEPYQRSKDGRELLFDLDANPPIDRLNLVLEGSNVVLRARIEFRADNQQPWREAHEGVFYQIRRDDQALASTPVTAGAAAAEWKVTIESGATQGAVRLQLGWRPQQLMFLAQGTPPFELVSGRALDQVEGFPQQTQLGDRSIFQILERNGDPGIAVMGPREIRAGDASLRIEKKTDWRTVLVWLGLSAAVLGVGWLVISLLREMRAKEI